MTVVAVSVVVLDVVDDFEGFQSAGGTDAAVTTTTVPAGGESVLNVGECLNDDELDKYLSGGDFSYVSCGDPHDFEVFFIHEFPEGAYPGDDVVIDDLKAVCRDQFDGYVGRDYESSALNTWSVWPGQGLWENGNRIGECLLFETDGGALTGSAFQSGW